MEKESQIKFTVTSTTVGELFDKTIDKFFKDKKYLNSISKKDNDPWSPPIGSKKEGGIFGTSKKSVSKAYPTQNVSVIKLAENSKKEKRKPHFRF